MGDEITELHINVSPESDVSLEQGDAVIFHLGLKANRTATGSQLLSPSNASTSHPLSSNILIKLQIWCARILDYVVIPILEGGG